MLDDLDSKWNDPWRTASYRARSGKPARARLPLAVLVGYLGSAACGQLETVATGSTPAPPEPTGEVVAVQAGDDAPESSDARPRVSLTLRGLDGTRRPIAGNYVDAVAFRDGMAAVTTREELRLVRGDGSQSVLARKIDGLPAVTTDGSLVYASRFGEIVEIHWLTVDGKNRRLVSLRGNATRLAPQPDGSVVFVGSKLGGVAGIWIARGGGAECVTNCGLRTGENWGNAYRPPPGSADRLRVSGTEIEWQTADGTWLSAPLKQAEVSR